MLVITFLNLYIVRVIIKGLGVEDYGIFNTIAGVVTVASFLTGVLSLSVQRFFSFYIGKNDIQKQTEIYSSCINIIAILSILIILLFETIGLWFVNTQLVIPAARMTAVMSIYHIYFYFFLVSNSIYCSYLCSRRYRRLCYCIYHRMFTQIRCSHTNWNVYDR